MKFIIRKGKSSINEPVFEVVRTTDTTVIATFWMRKNAELCAKELNKVYEKFARNFEAPN